MAIRAYFPKSGCSKFAQRFIERLMEKNGWSRPLIRIVARYNPNTFAELDQPSNKVPIHVPIGQMDQYVKADHHIRGWKIKCQEVARHKVSVTVSLLVRSDDLLRYIDPGITLRWQYRPDLDISTTNIKHRLRAMALNYAR